MPDFRDTELQNQLCQLAGILSEVKPALYGHDVLKTWDLELGDLKSVLGMAGALCGMRNLERSPRLFDTGVAISYFRDFSTRTRYSFASASSLLGLDIMPIDETSIQVAHGETTRETAAMLAFLTEVVGIRDDIYLGRGHAFMQTYAAALDQAAADGVVNRRPMIVNLQSDVDHPTQSMSDLAHLVDHFGGFDDLKGKRIAVTWAYSPSYGKPLSVSQGLIGLLTRFGMDVHLAHPEGYDLLPEVVRVGESQAAESGGRLTVGTDMNAAFANADVVYPKSWAPMWVHNERVALLDAQNADGLKDLEQRCLAENARHLDWECTAEKMALTKNGEALYMHCLPADITGVSCEAGEVSDDVFSAYRVPTYKQASYKPYVIAAMIALGRVENPSQLLRRWAEEPRLRQLF